LATSSALVDSSMSTRRGRASSTLRAARPAALGTQILCSVRQETCRRPAGFSCEHALSVQQEARCRPAGPPTLRTESAACAGGLDGECMFARYCH